MKPSIGVTIDVSNEGKYVLKTAYIQAIIQSGGLPIILPHGIEQDVNQVAAMIDGLLLSGGSDVDPMLFDEEPHTDLGEVSPSRDSTEIALVKQMLTLGKPILGLCRGIQVLNVALGGSLYQDIHSQLKGSVLQHMQKAPIAHPTHFVLVEEGSRLETIAESHRIKVNSFHHQALKEVADGLRVSGVATDGIIEAIEGTGEQFILGLQWHPEMLMIDGDMISIRIFKKFIEECANYSVGRV